jgi:hypothetical protein
VDAFRPLLESVTTPGEVTAISAQGPAEAGARSTLKPLSLKELSVHDRSIRVEEKAAAERLLGGNGIVERVVVPARFE